MENSAENGRFSPDTDLKSIGDVLRSKREKLSYSLEHVSEITKINLTYLRNIEEGKLDKSTGLIFIKGFIRNYAKLLGLDSDWMIKTLDQVYVFDKSQNILATPKLDETKKNRASLYLFLGLIALIAVSVEFFYWNSNFFSQSPPDTKVVEAVQEIDSGSDPQKDEVVIQAVVGRDEFESVTAEKRESTETMVNRLLHPLNLVLVAKSNDWIRLVVDKQEAKEILLTKGEKLKWPANQEYDLTMTTGNSATIHLNGEEIEVEDSAKDRLFQMKLDNFSLTRLNN